MDIYSQNILDHYKHPRHKGELKSPDAKKRAYNQSCGDDLTTYLKIKGDKISAISFTGQACAISTAAMSILSEALLGKTKEEVLALEIEDLKKILGLELSWRRERCAMLGLRALQGAILLTKTKNSK